MTKSTTWHEEGNKFETFKIHMRDEVKVLVKKNGKANHVVKFVKITGRIKNPTDN